ncbi:potassium channel family protein [Natronomonas marina]|jgi:Trk K+ transport system NAD-binding subunit|uniref:potassium channel family protein n=1 Tax=Natronomonas marina TaxID=2961939 RepID=UPI0020C9B435|nr:NAD-binding protein [Natronomonas marina]
MDSWQRRTLLYSAALLGTMLAYAVAYYYGMRVLEGEPTTFLHALQVVVETFTTTGFGSDAPWETPGMNLLVIVMDLTGVALIFLALPVFVFPLLGDALSTTVPTSVEGLSDHVVVCTYTSRAESLIGELRSRDVDYVVVEPDREQALELYEAGYTVVNADPEDAEALEGACLEDARALVADVSDEVDTSIVLTAREIADDVTVISVVEEPDRERYHRLAGADIVVSPRPLLGQSLASKVTSAVTANLDDAVEIGDDFEIAELAVQRGSRLAGSTLADSGIRERTGANVIGAWFEGEFRSPVSPDDTLTDGTVLLVSGENAQLSELRSLTRSPVRRVERGEVVVLGYGEVGRTVTDVLENADCEYTVVDLEDGDGVDVVGDATEPETLRAAGIEDARSAVLALPDDTVAEFTTLVIDDLSPDTEVVARVEDAQNVTKMYRAGADYVLALSTVTGRMVASALLEEQVLTPDLQIELVRTTVAELDGVSLAEADVRARTGCTVVAAERDGELITDIDADFVVDDGDTLIVAGTDEGIQRFSELAG